MNRYFKEFITQFKQDLVDKEQCIIRYELYGPNMESSYSKMAEEPLSYFLWYLEDQGYKYEITIEKKQVCDCMEGWCSQAFKIITIQLK